MRKVIAAINITIDGVCDHTVGMPSAEIHRHYAELLERSGVILYGSTTYGLMRYWQGISENPSGDETADNFAKTMNQIPKIVFSNRLKETGWESAVLATRSPAEVVHELKKQPGNDILVGSRSLIIQLTNLSLVDEYQLCVHPVIAGKGLPLFENIADIRFLNLEQTKTFANGALILYYSPAQAPDTTI